MILGAILWGALWLLIFALIVFTAILCAPVILGVNINAAEKFTLLVTMAIFGGLSPAFCVYDKRKKAPAEKTKKPARRRKKKKRKQFNFAASTPDIARAAPRFLAKIAARVKIDAINANISFGLPNPADTGVVYGALSPVLLLLNATPGFHISLRPDFRDSTLGGSGRIAVRFTPIALAPPMLGFGWRAFAAPRLSKVIR